MATNCCTAPTLQIGVARQQFKAKTSQLNNRRIHALGEKSLYVRIDGAVLGRYLIRRGLDSPCGSSGSCGCQRVGATTLNRVQRVCSGWLNIAGEFPEKGLLAQPAKFIGPYYSRAGDLATRHRRGMIGLNSPSLETLFMNNVTHLPPYARPVRVEADIPVSQRQER